MSRFHILLSFLLVALFTTGSTRAQQDAQPTGAVREELRSQSQTARATMPRESAQPVHSDGVTTDVLVNNNNGAGTTGNFTQSETSILAYGNHVVIGFNDAGSYTGSNSQFTGFSYSTNGGTSFVDGGTLPTSSVGDAGDPVLARNTTTGRIYFSTLGFNSPGTIQMWRSDDNGVTWMPPVNATPGGSSEDKQWHIVDNFPGTGNGNVYMISRRFGTGPGIYVFRSTDNGATFGPSGGTLIVSGNQGAFIEVGPDHSVYAFWWTSGAIQMKKSTDFGVTFGSTITVASGLVGGTNGDLGLTGVRQGTASASSFRSNSFPHVAVNPVSGNIYVTYNTDGAGSDKGDIFFVQSTDGGTTWSSPLKINDDATTTDQWQPAIAVNPSGTRVGIFYYSRQEDAANNLFKYYGRIGTISGPTVTFDPSFAVSDVASLPEFGRDAVINATYMGDYNHAAATDNAFHVVWSDNRDDLPGGGVRKDPNVYYKKVSYADPTDPNPPTNVTAYSDFTTPTSIQLSWTNPTTLVNGNPIGSFVMRIKRNGVQITEVTPPTATFNDGGRTTYTQYAYTLETRLTSNDSLSSAVQVSATAGGSPFPSPPTSVGFSATTTQATITWTNPTTQADGTPIHSFAGTRIWRNGVIRDSVGSGTTMYVDTPPPGFTYSYHLEAFNSLVQRRYSAPSASVGGYVGSLPSVLVWKPNAVTSSSADSIAASLTRLGISNFKTDTLYQFGTNLSPFQAIFVAVGIYPNNFIIRATRTEGGALDAYVQAGGNLYLEGGDVFNFDPDITNPGYMVRPIFGLNDGPDGGSDIAAVTGRTLNNGLTFSYTGGNSFMDELKPTDGGARILWIAPGSTPANDTMGVYNNYVNGRSVASVVEFGGLVDDGANKKDSVMSRIMAFFTQTAAPPEILIAPASLADTLQAGLSNNKILTISNTTTPPAQPLIVGLSEGVTWLSISPTADTIAGSASKNFTVTFNATGMTPGDYSTNVVVTSNDPDEPSTNVPVSLRVTGAPILTTQPDSLVKVVAPGTTATDTVVIKNTGQGPLTWSITDIPGGASRPYIPQPQADDLYPPRVGRDGWPIPMGKNDADLHHGPIVTEGQGGPDSAGYRWIDSDEPGGPVFSWFDISTIGTPVAVGEWLGSGGTPNADDGRVVKPLPFAFPFYGVNYDSLKIVTNGWMGFATASTNTAFSNVGIPAVGEPNNALYPWWDDLDLRTQGSVHYYHDAPNSRFIVQFTNAPHFGTAQPGVYTFQVMLYTDGRILYQYLDMQQTLNSATIGIENPTGTVALQVVFNASYMHNNLAILIAKDVHWLSQSPSGGTINPGDSTKVVVTFDATGFTDNTYTANLEILSNDVGNSPKLIPVQMIVGTGQVGVPILDGWNIISNPVNTSEDSVQQLFPTAAFAYAFAYAPGVGYSQQHTLAKGKGYWEKFPTATTQLISGSTRMADTVALVEGWNLVGSLSVPIDTSAAIGVPANIKASPFFSFVDGYVASGAIIPGKGYWLKANSNGSLIMTAPAPSAVVSSQSQTSADPWEGLGSITISDRAGRSQTLYFGSSMSASASYFELPPPAPEGAFDVRFESGRMVEHLSPELTGHAGFPITVRTGEALLEISWKLTADAGRMMLRDGSPNEHFAARVLEGSGSMIVPAAGVTRLFLSVESTMLPTEFVLDQNYPNPFNPTTSVQFGVPEASEVSLRIYDLLGREVGTIVQGRYTAGFYSIEWNGKRESGQTLSSGVYLYRLEAKTDAGSIHTMQKKMLLVK